MTQTTAPASVTVVEEYAATAPTAFVLCRTIGHRWPDWGVVDYLPRGRVRETVTCERCASAHRSQTWDADAYRAGSRIKYDDPAYLLPKGSGHLDRHGRAALRREREARRPVGRRPR